MTTERNYFTNYWLDSIDRDLVMPQDMGSSTSDLIYKNKLKRGVDNFVRALSKKDIPVEFLNTDTACTDFKTIYVPGNISAKNFDIVIGLSLHETAHNMYTETVIKTKYEFENYMKSNYYGLYTLLNTKYGTVLYSYYDKVYAPIFNIIEDRRIDNMVFETAPGYRGYYKSFYDKYFLNDVINKLINSNKYTKETWYCYIFHLCNFVNPNRRLDDLKCLRWMWNKIDLKNIARLKTSKEVINLVFEIIEYIETNTIPVCQPEDDKKQDDQNKDQQSSDDNGDNGSDQHGSEEDQPSSDDENEDNQSSGDNENEEDNDDSNNQQPSDQQDNDDSDNQQEDSKNQSSENKPIDNQTIEDNRYLKSEQSNKEYENAKKIIVHDYKGVHGMSVMSQTDRSKLRVMEQMNVQESSVDVNGRSQKVFEYFVPKNSGSTAAPGIYGCTTQTLACAKGFNIGKRLSKKLLIRNEDRSVIHSRLKRGRIDNRLIAEIGFGNEKIMNQVITTSYNPSFIHISIDNSGSMQGRRITESVVTATAIAVACALTGSINVQISVRSTIKNEVYITYIYDSRIHDLKQLKYYMGRIACTGGTPEGLTFGSILKQLQKINQKVDKYFINISDGDPVSINNIDTSDIIQHTKEMVAKIRKENVKVLSYMIDNKSIHFKEMYGKSAEYITESNIFDIAKTMNKQLLQSK